jgi:glycerophosphoryl diester phosphodiesterase
MPAARQATTLRLTLLVAATAFALTALPARPAPTPSAAGGSLAADRLTQPETPSEVDRLIALRGYSAMAPENTLAAIRAAAAAGVPRVWLDVRTTSDGQLVLLQDATLDRTTDCRGAVNELPAGIVTTCDAGSWFDARFAGEPVPRLAAALAIPEVRFVLELQEVASSAVLEVVRDAGAADRVILATSRDDILQAIHQEMPAVATWLRAAQLTGRNILRAEEVGADGLAIDALGLDAEQMLVAQDKRLAVAAVDVPDETALFDALALRVSWLVTARVEPSIRALGYRYRTWGEAALGQANVSGQAFGAALATGDFDGDRRADLAVGAPFDSRAAMLGGWVGIVLGGGPFPGRVVSLPGTERDGRWGEVFAVGDFNADGFDDLAVGYPLRDLNGPDSGMLWLWDGSRSGTDGLSRPIGPSLPAGSRLGASLAVGDFNGDGVADLAAGAPGATVMGQSRAGQVAVLVGRAGGGPTSFGGMVVDRGTRELPGDPVAREELGTALAAGDFDGDGDDDLAITVPEGDAPGLADAGSVLRVYSGLTPVTRTLRVDRVEELTRADEDLPGDPSRQDGFGAALAAADFDRDGFGDLAIGAPGAKVEDATGAGEVVLLYGAAAGRDPRRTASIHQNTPLIPDTTESRDAFGSSLAVGDVDGDGFPDLVVGTPNEAVRSLPGVGEVAVVYGGAGGLQARLALEIVPGMLPLGFAPNNRQAFGRALAVGDLNGDGVADVAMGSPGQSIDGVIESGAFTVAWGYHPALPNVPTATTGPPAGTATPTAGPTAAVTATPSPGGATATATAQIATTPAATVTPGPSPAARPPEPVFLPYTARLGFLGRSGRMKDEG